MGKERKVKGERPVESWQMREKPVDDVNRLVGFELGTGHKIVFRADSQNTERQVARRRVKTGRNNGGHRKGR